MILQFERAKLHSSVWLPPRQNKAKCGHVRKREALAPVKLNLVSFYLLFLCDMHSVSHKQFCTGVNTLQMTMQFQNIVGTVLEINWLILWGVCGCCHIIVSEALSGEIQQSGVQVWPPVSTVRTAFIFRSFKLENVSNVRRGPV